MWNREYHSWHSSRLGRTMEFLVLGHGGARVLVFPTSLGRFYEWEDRGMAGALGEQLERGWLQLWCVDSVDGESWYDRGKPPEARARRHEEYEAYLLHELLPYSFHRNPNPFLIVTGASFGAYHAVNFAFRHPGIVGRVVGLSGLYDVKRIAGGHGDHGLYRNDPSHYMLHEGDPAWLEAVKRLDIILAIGRDDPARADNEHLSGALWSRGIWHALRIWDGWCHDWPWWRQMIARYVAGHD